MFVILAVAALFLLRVFGVSGSIDRFLWETRFSFDQRSVSGEIVLVDIDARSLGELGVWPLPRRVFAQLTDRLAEEDAREIVFDVDFSAVSNPEDDRIFADAIERAGNVSLAVFSQSASAGGDATKVTNVPLDRFLENAWPVVVMVPMETDSRIWRNLYGYEIEGVSEVSASAFLGDHTGNAAGSFGLDYSIAIDRLPRVSLVDVLHGAYEPGVFAEKKIIIGASALELRDLFPVPVFDILPGSVIQALGAETLLQKRAMTVQGEWMAVFLVSVIFLLLLMTKVEGWVIKIVILCLAALVIEVLAFGIQKSSPILVPTASAHFVLLFAAASVVVRELGFHKLLSHIATIKRRNSERMLGQVFDDSFDAIVVIDKEGRITAANSTARTLFASDALVGELARSVLPLALVEETIAVLAAGTECVAAPRTITLSGEGLSQQFIEFVVTRSERTLARKDERRDLETEALACLTCRDVTEERQATERLRYLARFDPITDLLNRGGFEKDLTRLMEEVQHQGRDLCLVQFAVSNFDQIIATLGFSYGDRIRQEIAARLKSHLSLETTWSAITADVFAGVFPCEQSNDRILSRIEKIRRVICEDYSIEGARISVQLKFGFVQSDGRNGSEDLLRRSGNALAKARRDERFEVLRFEPEMGAALQRRRKLETELFKAIARDELRLEYQPLVNLEDNSVFGTEALLRWQNREFGNVSPVEFIPIAEENGYIVELGAWALNRGMKEALGWQKPLRLSVNISPVQFTRGNLVTTVSEALERNRFPADRLDLEVTESLFLGDSQDLKFCMEELKAFGCSFSLDDFGTGYSSLGYIPKFPFSKIKLDQSFVRQSFSNEKDVAVIEAVLHLARGYGMSVLVEGIETPDQASKLKELGCPLGQGYLFGRPMSAIDLAATLVKAA
ncbi:MAG: EAL domain-containing protein [Roseibium sp.]|uniref:EAL domain-containing protein n=1 Tax=Roseibium sp. TaxID=1936156 RepID=UPI0026136CC2|nr:EAL domain-containing protein [Roseibium sp.]MCV0426098.1 EAL domain-containing protein [Roseibium sp.]